ncbi:RNA polymerase sigma factor, partial [Streptomyces antibioticus]|uniref:RNA polymerase sigma factor n=1 Tax=Streptomyces antibioticus TaxID=1890 RepID=UPI003F46D721
HQRGHRPQPQGLLRRRRQMPRVPHQIAHTPPTTQNPNRFGSILPDRWSTIEHPRAWLRKVACRSWWRQHERNREDTADALPDLPGGLSPVTEIELSEQAQRVLHAVKQLPAMQRAVMAFFLDGADTSEIAGALNMSEDAVRANASRARRRLKEILRFERGENNA